MSEHLASQPCDALARDPFPSHLIKNTEVCCMTGEWAWRTAARGLGQHQKNMDPTNCVVHSIRKATNEPLGSPIDPPNWYRHPQCSTALPHPVVSSWSMLPVAARASPCRKLVHTCKKPAQICRTVRKHTNGSTQ